MISKIFVTATVLLFFSVNQSYGYANNRSISTHNNDNPFLEMLTSVYKELVNGIKDGTKKIITKLHKPISNFLSCLAVIWTIGTALQCYIKGISITNAFMSKIGLLVVLHLLLNYSTFNSYILTHLETVFNHLPPYLVSVPVKENILANLTDHTASILNQIYNVIESNASFSMRYILLLICCIFAFIAVLSLTLQVLLTSLVATIKFYLVLSISSMWILLAFFKTTRNLSIQAINVVIGCICQMCFLFIILGLTGNIFTKILNKINTIETISNIIPLFISVVVLCALDFFLIREGNALAEYISSLGTISTHKDLTKSLKTSVKSKIPVRKFKLRK